MDEERPEPRDADELHDALVTTGFLLDGEVTADVATLASAKRATRFTVASRPAPLAVWVAAERLPELLAVHPDATFEPRIVAPAARAARVWTREAAVVELLRGRLSIAGPTTAAALAVSLGITEADADVALLTLEGDGVVLRGTFSPAPVAAATALASGRQVASGFSRKTEWCDRRLLARIHRYTLNRLRAEIAPVSQADFMRFLFAWQHVAPASQLLGVEGLRAVVAQLDGVELPARAWERDVLAARVERYEPAMLDMLCLTGEVSWARLSSGPTQVVGATPIALFLREHGSAWFGAREDGEPHVCETARAVLERLHTGGALFATELVASCALTHDQIHASLGELVAAGAISSDGFAGLRTLIGITRAGVNAAGRWFALGVRGRSTPASGSDPAAARLTIAETETVAWAMLRRYGVVFRRLLTREAVSVPWRELVQVYRRLEARGEIRGGRFVSGMSGEQFALPEAVERLREVRRTPADDRLIAISAADPLNLTGIVTPGDRVRAVAGNRLVYRNGVPVGAMEGDMLRMLEPVDPGIGPDVAAAAAGRRVPVVSGYVGQLRR